jgi:predicted lipoprotein with Yx(FWY)xxD motif
MLLASLVGLASTTGPASPARAQEIVPPPEELMPPTVAIAQHPVLGPLLTDPAGRTLYVYGADTPDRTTCTGPCEQAWPPYVIDGDPIAPAELPGELGAIMRPDGTRQVTYDHLPLYYYSRDAQPGDTNGQGIGGVWFVATPVATPVPAEGAPVDAGQTPPAPTTPPPYRERREYGDYGY